MNASSNFESKSNLTVCMEPEMIIGPNDQCICQEDTFHDGPHMCIPCPEESSTHGMTGAQSVHECSQYSCCLDWLYPVVFCFQMTVNQILSSS